MDGEEEEKITQYYDKTILQKQTMFVYESQSVGLEMLEANSTLRLCVCEKQIG